MLSAIPTLYWDNLITLTEAETIINTHPLIYVWVCVDTSSVLAVYHEIVIHLCTDDCENSDCHPEMDSVKE